MDAESVRSGEGGFETAPCAAARYGRFVYTFGGFEIESALPLAGVRPSLDPGSTPFVRVLVDRGCPVPSGPPVFRWRGLYGLALSSCEDGWLITSRNHGSVVVSDDGCEVRCYPDSASSADWPDVLVRRILPRLAQRHGHVVLHAAALSDGRSVTLLLGASHSGKSTLAAALQRYLGWSVFSDDFAVVDYLASPPVCLPVGAGLCLLPDSLAAFAVQQPECRKVAGHDDKRWQIESADDAMPPGPVTSLLLLSPDGIMEDSVETVSLRRVSPLEAARQGSASLILFNPADILMRAHSWSALGRLVDAVPTYVLSYPRRYECLQAVAETVRALSADRAALTA